MIKHVRWLLTLPYFIICSSAVMMFLSCRSAGSGSSFFPTRFSTPCTVCSNMPARTTTVCRSTQLPPLIPTTSHISASSDASSPWWALLWSSPMKSDFKFDLSWTLYCKRQRMSSAVLSLLFCVCATENSTSNLFSVFSLFHFLSWSFSELSTNCRNSPTVPNCLHRFLLVEEPVNILESCRVSHRAAVDDHFH